MYLESNNIENGSTVIQKQNCLSVCLFLFKIQNWSAEDKGEFTWDS